MGKCKVDKDDEGRWWIECIEKDPNLVKQQVMVASLGLTRQEDESREQKHELDEQERMYRLVDAQMKRALKGAKPEEEQHAEFVREGDKKISFSLKRPISQISKQEGEEEGDDDDDADEEADDGVEEDGEGELTEADMALLSNALFGGASEEAFAGDEEGPKDEGAEVELDDVKESPAMVEAKVEAPAAKPAVEKASAVTAAAFMVKKSTRPVERAMSSLREKEKMFGVRCGSDFGSVSNVESIIEEEKLKKMKAARKDHWLYPGIVVKVLNKRVGDGKYFKCKGVSGHVVRLTLARGDPSGHQRIRCGGPNARQR